MVKVWLVYFVIISLLIIIPAFIASPILTVLFNSNSTKDDSSDLTVINIIEDINQADKNVSLLIWIKNIGKKISDNSVTKISTGPLIFLIDTPPIFPGETESLPQIYYFQPANTTYHVKITADANEEINETDENNNYYEIDTVMP
jgi:subtilase family serine protease